MGRIETADELMARWWTVRLELMPASDDTTRKLLYMLSIKIHDNELTEDTAYEAIRYFWVNVKEISRHVSWSVRSL